MILFMNQEHSSSKVQKYFFFGLLAAVTVLFLWILGSYLLPILWAAVFAILLYPIFEYVRKGVASRSASAALTILLALLVIFVPASILAALLIEDSVSIYQEAATAAPAYVDAVSNSAFIKEALDFFQLDVGELETLVVNSARNASAWLATQVFSLGARTFSTVIKFFIMLYLLFFFLKDGDKIIARLERTISLGGRRERTLFEKFATTVKAIFNGTIVIAVIQGVLGGILFAALGIENAVLWGALMGFLSIIPAVGPSFVWVPAAIIYFALGSLPTVLALVVGGIGISLLDNLLKPLLVGRSTKMPDPLILISIFGGIVTFGLAGVVLGPVIAALFLSFWDLFAEEYKSELVG